MYNRYVPRPDGSYAKRRVAGSPVNKTSQQRSYKPPQLQPEPDIPPTKESVHRIDHTDFLRRLLPKNFDSGDLIVILLLLLMAGDSQEEKNNAILTIALYFLL